MTELRTWHEILIEDMAANPEETIDYFDMSLQEYQCDGDTLFFLKGIRNIIEALGGVSEIAKQTDTAPEALLDLLFSDDAPRLDTLNTLANALGCRLSIEPIMAANSNRETKNEDHPVPPQEATPPSLEIPND